MRSHRPVLLLTLAGLTLLPVTSASALDIFIGTVAMENKELILTRCNIAKSRYVLVDKDNQTAPLIQQFPNIADIPKRKITVTVIADYELRSEQNYLIVDHFDDINMGNSCHLSDFLDGKE